MSYIHIYLSLNFNLFIIHSISSSFTTGNLSFLTNILLFILSLLISIFTESNISGLCIKTTLISFPYNFISLSPITDPLDSLILWNFTLK